MADTKQVVSPAPKKGRGWLKALGWVFGIFIVLLVAAYFVGTSAGFLKGVILPRVSKSINADVTVSDASISPFKQVILKDLKVQAKGEEPLLIAREVRARYSLMDIIGGHINVDEAVVVSPTIQIVEKPDGTSNLDPITKSQEQPKEERKKEQERKASKPPQIDIKKIEITGATIRKVKVYKGNTRDLEELSNANLTLENLKNGQTVKLALGADVSVQNNPSPPGTNGALAGKLSGNFTFALTPDLKPASIQGNTRVEVTQASGALSDAASLNTELNCDVTPTEIRQVALRLLKGNTPLGQVLVNGPFDTAKTEGKLTVQLLSIDKQVLNLVGAKQGLDFGSTTVNSTNHIQVAKSGKEITASGRLNMNKFQVTRTNQTTPPLDLAANYDLTIDNTAKTALLRLLTINGVQKGNPLLHAELTSPMTLAFGGTANAVSDSALKLTITNFDFAEWKPFLGEVAPTGVLNAQAKLLSQQAGKLLAFELNSQIANLTAKVGSNELTQAAVTLKANGKATDLKQFNLSEYSFQLAQQNQQLLTLSGTGIYDTESKTADMQIIMQAFLARSLQAIPQPDITVSSGTVSLKAHVTQKGDTQSVNGNFSLGDFTGKFGNSELQNFGVNADIDVANTPQKLQINKASGTLNSAGKPGGSFELSGTFATNKTAQLTAKLLDLNQNGLGPFLQPSLGDKKLVSLAVNGNASVQYDPSDASAIKADLQVTNLVVNDPKGEIPNTPIAARMQVDTALNKQIADIRQFQIGFTPTARAANNAVQLSGHVDMTQSNAITGNVKLAGDALDLTTYYDLFGGNKKAEEKKPATQAKAEPQPRSRSKPSTVTPGAEPEKEPDAKQLPFRNFVAEVTLGRLYLREVDISSLQTTAKINGAHVLLNPCKLALNGAPVNANVDLDLGVPGYKYNVSFSASSVPLAPLVNTFVPERKGDMGGTLTAQANVTGVGMTGASLQRTLTGQFDITSTNLNLSIDKVKSRLIKLIVNVVGALPELIRNPAGGALALFEGVTGLGNGGLMDDLRKSPINTVSAKGVAGSGKVELQTASLASAAFRADATGTVTLAPILTNSAIHLPVSISPGQALAQRIGFSVDTNSGYAKMPDFLLITGTIGDPKPDRRKLLVLGTTAVKGILNAIPGTGSAGNIVNQLGGLITGGNQTSTNTSGTNVPTKTGNLLQGLNSILGGAAGNTNTSPNAAGTNAPATNQSPVNSLLNDLLKPKKKK